MCWTRAKINVFAQIIFIFDICISAFSNIKTYEDEHKTPVWVMMMKERMKNKRKKNERYQVRGSNEMLTVKRQSSSLKYRHQRCFMTAK